MTNGCGCHLGSVCGPACESGAHHGGCSQEDLVNAIEKIIIEEQRCQEVTGMLGDAYLRCGQPAVMLIKHNGRDEGPYFMCGPCGNHNVKNRNARVVLIKTGEERWVA